MNLYILLIPCLRSTLSFSFPCPSIFFPAGTCIDGGSLTYSLSIVCPLSVVLQAQNSLEALVYKAQDASKASQGGDADKAAVAKAAAVVEKWLEESAEEASLEDFKAKTTELESLMAKLTV